MPPIRLRWVLTVAFLVAAPIATYQNYVQNNPAPDSRAQTDVAQPEKAKYFDSDRLMEMFERAGIMARCCGDLVVRGDLLTPEASNRLEHVLLIYVKQPLTSQETKVAAATAVRFFSSRERWTLPWRYEGLGIQADTGDGKIHLVALRDPAQPTEIDTNDANYEFYWHVVSDLVDRDALKEDESHLDDRGKSRLAALQQKYPRERIIEIYREPVMPFLPKAITYVDGNGFNRKIIINQPLPVLERRLHAAEQAAIDADLERKAYRGEMPTFKRGGIIFNEIDNRDGQETFGARIGLIRGSEDANLLDNLWHAVLSLPVKDRAIIIRRKLLDADSGPFNAFKIQFDPDGKGKRMVLATVIAPLDKEIVSPELSVQGLKVRFIILNGLIKYIISFATVTAFEYDDLHAEVSSKTYRNMTQGIDKFLSLNQSERDEMLVDSNQILFSKTTDRWFIDPKEDVSPYKPAIRKIIISFIDGSIKLVTCGLFDSPIKVVTKQNVVDYFFDDDGVPLRQSAARNVTEKFFPNEHDKQDVEDLVEKLLRDRPPTSSQSDLRNDVFQFTYCATYQL